MPGRPEHNTINNKMHAFISLFFCKVCTDRDFVQRSTDDWSVGAPKASDSFKLPDTLSFEFEFILNIKKKPMNIVWLIDMGYVTKASKGRGKVDYLMTKKFLEEKLKGPCLPIIFNSVDSYGVDVGLNQFYYTMKKAGFVVNLYQMEGGAQKQVDVAIGAHLVYYALKGYAIVLSSGDIDFVPAINLARKDQELHLTLLTYNFGVHDELIKLSTEHLLFEDHPRIIRK